VGELPDVDAASVMGRRLGRRLTLCRWHSLRLDRGGRRGGGDEDRVVEKAGRVLGGRQGLGWRRPTRLMGPMTEVRLSKSATETSVRSDVRVLDRLVDLVGKLVLAPNQIVQHTSTIAIQELVDRTVPRRSTDTPPLAGHTPSPSVMPTVRAWQLCAQNSVSAHKQQTAVRIVVDVDQPAKPDARSR
jgi:hypothetical protein